MYIQKNLEYLFLNKSRVHVTISEARGRATSLLVKLDDRDIHDDVRRFCTEELLADNYFHAILEISKSIAHKIRTKAELDGDGTPLVQEAFSINAPKLRINSLSSSSEESEQKGFCNLLVGFFGLFRNPVGHEARIFWAVHEIDALDVMSTASLIHRKLDEAEKV